MLLVHLYNCLLKIKPSSQVVTCPTRIICLDFCILDVFLCLFLAPPSLGQRIMLLGKEVVPFQALSKCPLVQLQWSTQVPIVTFRFQGDSGCFLVKNLGKSLLSSFPSPDAKFLAWRGRIVDHFMTLISMLRCPS